MLLFAEGVTSLSVGETLLALVAILLLVEKIKALFWPTRTVQEEYVRKADLDAFRNDMRTEVQEITVKIAGLVPRNEFTRVEAQLAEIVKEYKELREYTHTRVHELTTKVHEIQLRMEVLHRDGQRDLERSTDKILTQIERLTDVKVDRTTVTRSNILDAGGNLIKPH